jgi:murein DD-endopeptidase MepM/ murein hydrolase activator NlpD
MLASYFFYEVQIYNIQSRGMNYFCVMLKFVMVSILLFLHFFCQAQITKQEIRTLYKTPIDSTKQYIYQLPFKKGKKVWVIQGYLGRFSHKNRLALDFKIKKGDTVYATREGVVVRMKKDGIKGGLKNKYRQEGNLLIIQHNDGTRGGYWHFKHNEVFAKVGDTIQKGQPIGLAGKTGYASAAHLHFLVWHYVNNTWQQIATAFYTSKGIRYIKPLHKYRW